MLVATPKIIRNKWFVTNKLIPITERIVTTEWIVITEKVRDLDRISFF